jgi:hypothetical protein
MQMKIDDDHLYHGAALIQIAEHPQFTAINALKRGTKTYRVAYKVNDSIAVYLKYATKPIGAAAEYVFTFNEENLAELNEIVSVTPKTFVVLVCVRDRQNCCVSHAELQELIARR